MCVVVSFATLRWFTKKLVFVISVFIFSSRFLRASTEHVMGSSLRSAVMPLMYWYEAVNLDLALLAAALRMRLVYFKSNEFVAPIF